MENSVDIIVLGATSFSGKYTVHRLASLTEERYCNITWGIAGQSKEKLQNLIQELNRTGYNTRDIMVFESEIINEDSLKEITQAAKVVINTDPNILLSTLTVNACIETGTHYVDISAEMLHVLNLYWNYHKRAEDANVLVIPSCGFATMPVATGLIYLERQFKGTLHTVECYAELVLPKCLPCGAVVHNDTWSSFVHFLESYREHETLETDIFGPPIEPVPEEMKRSYFFRKNGRLWFPWPGIENTSMKLAQRYLHEKNKKKPLHFKAYTTFQVVFQFLVMPIMFMYYCLSYFKCFTKLLIRFPQLFTLGYVSEKGPSDKMRQDTKYSFILNGKGWEIDHDLNSEPTKTLSVKVSSQDPICDSTSIAVIMSAITVLKESSNMPKGGVIMPGAAFFRTDIVDRLMHDGYTIEVLKR